MSAKIRKIGEYLGLLAGVVLLWQLFASERGFPSKKVASTGAGLVNFLSDNADKIIYLEFYQSNIEDYEDWMENCSGDPSACEAHPDDTFSTIFRDISTEIHFDLKSSDGNPLATLTFGVADDPSYNFSGPVKIEKQRTEDGNAYFLSVPPFSDNLASRTNCSKQLIGTKYWARVRRYIKHCFIEF